VQDVDGDPLNLKHVGCRNLLCPGFAIYVAANCGERRDLTELLQDVRITDVPGVSDVVGATQSGEGLRAKQAVGVGDDADEDGSSQVRFISAFISA
jgi:hypothetical protein